MQIFNCLLDGFPTKYKGYTINTDWRIGVLISLLLDDEEIPFDLRVMQSLNLLYKDKVPDDPDLAFNGVLWFLSCGKSEICYADGYQDDKPNEPCIDFTQDHLDIWGGFWSKGIDLETADMHWFKFMQALANLGDCPMSQKMSYRATNTSKMSGETKKYYNELKMKYRVRKIVTAEEYEKLCEAAEQKHGSYYAKLMRAQRR